MVKEEAEAYVEKAKAIYAEGKLEDAVMMYQMAAERGNVDACFGLAECYFTGKGITQDYVEALKWYTLAAEQGHKEAAQKARKCKWNLFWKK